MPRLLTGRNVSTSCHIQQNIVSVRYGSSRCRLPGSFMQSQRPVYIPSSLSLYAKKRSVGLIATQLSAIEEGVKHVSKHFSRGGTDTWG